MFVRIYWVCVWTLFLLQTSHEENCPDSLISSRESQVPSDTAVSASSATGCVLSTSLSVQSVQACYWHTEMKEWIAALPLVASKTETTSAVDQTSAVISPSSSELVSSPGCHDNTASPQGFAKLQAVLAQLPSALRVKVCSLLSAGMCVFSLVLYNFFVWSSIFSLLSAI